MNDSTRAPGLLRIILSAVGASACAATAIVACGSESVDSSFDSGADTAGETDGASRADTAVADTSPASDASRPPFDASPVCADTPVSNEGVTAAAACGGTVDAGAGQFFRICFARPDAASCESTYSAACVLSKYRCGLSNRGTDACGPLPDRADACCYDVVGVCAVGRPFTVDGMARLPTITGDDAWAGAHSLALTNLDLDRLSPSARRALAEWWTEEGRTEHASIASFARMTLELLSLGAPPALVDETLRAGMDERRHAAAAFAFARAYGGVAVGPGPLPIEGCLGDSDIGSIAERVAAEGCIAETISALLIAEASTQATCDVVAQHLAAVAAEEQAHAVLAWKQLAWILATGDDVVRARVERVFAEAAKHVGIGPVASAGAHDELRGHGHMPPAERRAIARSVLVSVVAPAARALLALPSPAAVRTELFV